MEEDTKGTQAAENSAEANNEEKKSESQTKTFTQEQLNEVLQKRLADEQKKFEKTLEAKISETLAEAQRQAQLSQEEKEKELMEKSRKEIAEKERELNLKENKIAAYEKLSELGMSVDLVDFVLAEDKDQMFARIEKLREQYTEAVNKGVESKMSGESKPAIGEPNKPPKVAPVKTTL